MSTRPCHLGTTLNSKGPHVTSEKNASAIEVLFRISLHSCDYIFGNLYKKNLKKACRIHHMHLQLLIIALSNITF